jgi:hypothetical protein
MPPGQDAIDDGAIAGVERSLVGAYSKNTAGLGQLKKALSTRAQPPVQD